MAPGGHHNILFTVHLVGHGHRVAAGGEVRAPQLLAGMQVVGPQAVIQGVTDKHQAAAGDQWSSRTGCTQLHGNGDRCHFADIAQWYLPDQFLVDDVHC